MNYARFINPISAGRYLSPLRKLTEIQTLGGPSLIALGTGAPNADCYPFEKIAITTKDKKEFILDGKLLSVALSYGASPGLPDLITWLKDLQIKIHKPPMAEKNRPDESKLELIILPGSQDGLSKSIEMLVQPGDSVLIEEPVYPGTTAVLKPFGVNFLAIESDENGIKPTSLKKLLSKWPIDEIRKNDTKVPKLLLVQPNHCNPTGVSINLDRRKEIYQIAQEYDLVIVEDDPYYFLTFGGRLPPPSFLSLDTDGRVMKLDSFSKVLSGGMRIGTLTGPKALVDRVLLHVATSSLQCSTLSQMIVWQLLQSWGHDGFLAHAKRVAEFYESQCQKMLKAAEMHLKGLAEWYTPTGGMFLWIRVPGVNDTYKMITEKALSKQVVLAPGCFFMTDVKRPTSFLRASFSAVSEEQMQEAFRRLAELIREEQAANEKS